MLSEKIAVLYDLLQCSNTDIARFAGCSPGNISKLKTGRRMPEPSSRSIAAFAEGVYGYADFENMLTVLQELCGVPDVNRESLIPALIAWLYDAGDAALPSRRAVPRSKRTKARQRQDFGAKLDRVMTLLGLSNGILAGMLHVDPSLISRYRSGIYSPHGNPQVVEQLSLILYSRAEKRNQTAALAELCSVGEEDLDEDFLAMWLTQIIPADGFPADGSSMAQMVLCSLDQFVPVSKPAQGMPDLPAPAVASCYWGTNGLRDAVLRFLSDAAQEGGELLLYSDEPMDWMSGDAVFFARWKFLMRKCVERGIKIRIIHNVDREDREMFDAIAGWFPLYISGMIEPYVFRRSRHNRFHHTMFLHTGRACIRGFSPAESEGDCRWYDYIEDRDHLKALHSEYDAMLSAASPFLKVYTSAESESLRDRFAERRGTTVLMLNEWPICTIPEGVAEAILRRTGIPEPRRNELLSLCRRLRAQFVDRLRREPVQMILCRSGIGAEPGRKVNFSFDLLDVSVRYTEEEYHAHVRAVMELVKNEKNFHLTLPDESPFRDIQIAVQGDTVAVLRCQDPHAAFVFTNSALTESVTAYLSALIRDHAADRHVLLQELQDML